jgi:hypothetical protein
MEIITRHDATDNCVEAKKPIVLASVVYRYDLISMFSISDTQYITSSIKALSLS